MTISLSAAESSARARAKSVTRPVSGTVRAYHVKPEIIVHRKEQIVVTQVERP